MEVIKETPELLNILQGKDVESYDKEVVEKMDMNTVNSKSLETQLALQQLTRLKKIKRKGAQKWNLIIRMIFLGISN
ncbi:unnamed protein product [Parnassius apollo]|uniref:(apollo) hypothetical protein n=1 Tax=Parnassius apollo TaxID=110799 RepID=A0A8S3XEY0_PARAO|nr:unnamed protein product [Parnassius apollo]